MVSEDCHASWVKKQALLTPGVSAAGMVQRELCQQQEHDACVRRQSSAQGHLCKGNLCHTVFLFHLFVFLFVPKLISLCSKSQSAMNSQVKFLTLQLCPKISELQHSVG